MRLRGEKISWLFLVLLLSIGMATTAKDLYRFSFSIKGEVAGRFLFVFPYHVYMETGASALFEAERSEHGSHRFSLHGIDGPGFLTRSLGFSGQRLAYLTAAFDMNRALRFIHDKQRLFRQQSPMYAERVKATHKFLLKISDQHKGAIVFERDDGRHTNFRGTLPLDPQYDPGKVGLDFKVYDIMGYALLASHIQIGLKSHEDGRRAWESSGWDFSEYFNNIAWAISGYFKKYLHFRQRHPISLKFHVTVLENGVIVVSGRSNQNVPIWRHFVIRKVERRLRFSPEYRRLISDSLHLEIRDKKGRGGVARTLLKLVEKNPS
jgi:hypothetical protein